MSYRAAEADLRASWSDALPVAEILRRLHRVTVFQPPDGEVGAASSSLVGRMPDSPSAGATTIASSPAASTAAFTAGLHCRMMATAAPRSNSRRSRILASRSRSPSEEHRRAMAEADRRARRRSPVPSCARASTGALDHSARRRSRWSSGSIRIAAPVVRLSR